MSLRPNHSDHFLELYHSTSLKKQRVALIPAYNEERFIGSMVLQVRQYVDHVVVVDDGSTDTTAQTARDAGAEVLSLVKNGGKARAVSEGIRHIRRLQPIVVVMIDGDGQHNPREIPAMIEPIEAGVADMVIGSRFIGVESDIPGWRKIGQHLLTFATNKASGTHSTDSQSGFRAFSAEALPCLDFTAAGFSVESEMQFIAQTNDLRLVEVPISVIYAEPPKRNPIPHALQVLNGVLRLVGQHRPLLFFGVPGLFLLVAGLLLGGWVVHIYQTSSQLAIGYTLASVLLCVTGSIGFASGVILHSIRGLLLEWREHDARQQKTRGHLA